MNTFEKTVILDAKKEMVFEYHEKPGALKRLSPPWQKLKVIKQTKGILEGSRVTMDLYDPVKIRWKALHTKYEKDSFFEDLQLKGPFYSWTHSHSFKDIHDHNSFMTDKIKYSLFLDKITGFIFKSALQNKLERIFSYRHKILKRDIESMKKFTGKKTILLGGASGLLGSLLIAKLSACGHNVKLLVRKYPENENEYYWNSQKRLIDKRCFDNVDVVINLSGEPIGAGIWTKSKKKKIIDSRVDTTSLIAETIDELKNPPELFISASATGFYGNRGAEKLDENSSKGKLFISRVCDEWEKASILKKNTSTRIINLRTGLVFTPEGGVLPLILQSFYTGFSGVPGSGNQYLSWISSEDWINIIYESIFNTNIHGAVNACSPDPMTFKEIMDTISDITGIPYYLKIPAPVIKFLLGQRGYETILCGSRAYPEKMISNGFSFFHNSLENALREMLGKEKNLN
ncbi:MAG: TIGR01777 family protein [Deltaproteobacteria bacterium]|nr:MAG: TIGR01777 family protein [Deltaproteobacteria bacterium]PIE74998.1 MAG: TIGR01777 family protein [Deltaproteobacteria bacterium]